MSQLCQMCLEVICCCESYTRPQPRTHSDWEEWCHLVEDEEPFGSTRGIVLGEANIFDTSLAVECGRCQLLYKAEHTGRVTIVGTTGDGFNMCIGCLEHTALELEIVSPPPCHICGSREPNGPGGHISDTGDHPPMQSHIQRENGMETVWTHSWCLVVRSAQRRKEMGLE